MAIQGVDNKDDKEGDESLKALELVHGQLPKTFTVKTPSGGFHYYFKGAGSNTTGRLGNLVHAQADELVSVESSQRLFVLINVSLKLNRQVARGVERLREVLGAIQLRRTPQINWLRLFIRVTAVVGHEGRAAACIRCSADRLTRLHIGSGRAVSVGRMPGTEREDFTTRVVGRRSGEEDSSPSRSDKERGWAG